MVSPLRKQRDAILASQQVKEMPELSGVTPNSMHLLLAELDIDLKVLKGFNRLEDKVQHKREKLVPKYRSVIEEFLVGDEHFDNPLFAQMVVWMFDIGELETAIEWCVKGIELGLDTPERFKRDFATFCADEVLEWSERMANQGHSIEPYFSQIFEKIQNEWRINERITAKWFKFAGLQLLRNNKHGKPIASSVGDIPTLEKSRVLLVEAQELHQAIGVKTTIDKIDQRIRAITDGKNL